MARLLTNAELELVSGGAQLDMMSNEDGSAPPGDEIGVMQVSSFDGHDMSGWLNTGGESDALFDSMYGNDPATGDSGSSCGQPGQSQALPPGYHAYPGDSGNHYMIRDGDTSNRPVNTPQWQSRIDNGHTNWAGVAYDLTNIALNAAGGAGSGVRVVAGIAGGVLGGFQKPGK